MPPPRRRSPNLSCATPRGAPPKRVFARRVPARIATLTRRVGSSGSHLGQATLQTLAGRLVVGREGEVARGERDGRSKARSGGISPRFTSGWDPWDPGGSRLEIGRIPVGRPPGRITWVADRYDRC